MPLVPRWGSVVTTVPPAEPGVDNPQPVTLELRPLPIDQTPKAESLGSKAGDPVPIKA